MRIREAREEDATRLPPLLGQLGYPEQAAGVAGRLRALLAPGGRAAVLLAEAEEDGSLLGVLALHWGEMLHLDGPVARIGTLVVEETTRGGGVGAALVAAAEARARAEGCTLLEVTSGRRRERTHRFYQAQGFRLGSVRLHKVLG
jgi:GNAT superfamily N-acetyltransferase